MKVAKTYLGLRTTWRRVWVERSERRVPKLLDVAEALLQSNRCRVVRIVAAALGRRRRSAALGRRSIPKVRAHVGRSEER